MNTSEETKRLNEVLFEKLSDEKSNTDALNTYAVDVMRQGGLKGMLGEALSRPETPLERERRGHA